MSSHDQKPACVLVHSLPVRLMHWFNVVAFGLMLASGWRIYNASPLFAFRFPADLTLGGWLGGALQWHFAAMWLLAANGLFYLAYGLVSGHFRRKLWPIRPAAVLADMLAAMRGKLAHDDLAAYNAAQRAAYVALVAGLALLALSGLAIWKPFQFHLLAQLFGGYEGARLVHFVAMALTLGIVIVHVAMVVLVPRTLLAMLSGRVKEMQA